MQAQTLTTGATTPTSPLEFTTPPVAKEATQLSSTNCARFTVLCTYLVTIYCTLYRFAVLCTYLVMTQDFCLAATFLGCRSILQRAVRRGKYDA